MTKTIKGTKTEINLASSFAGECMARTRYAFFASKAKKEGYEQISEIFLETAENEKTFINMQKHLLVSFKMMDQQFQSHSMFLIILSQQHLKI